MKTYACDKCGKTLDIGPLGAYHNVSIMIQPSYDMALVDYSWQLCPNHSTLLQQFIAAFLKEPNDS